MHIFFRTCIFHWKIQCVVKVNLQYTRLQVCASLLLHFYKGKPKCIYFYMCILSCSRGADGFRHLIEVLFFLVVGYLLVLRLLGFDSRNPSLAFYLIFISILDANVKYLFVFCGCIVANCLVKFAVVGSFVELNCIFVFCINNGFLMLYRPRVEST